MIPVDLLLYEMDQKLNKLASTANQSIPLENKILALNEAQIRLVKQKTSGMSIPSRLGMDSFRKRYEDLQVLVEDYKSSPLDLSKEDETLNQWSVDLKDLKHTHLFYIDSYALADKGNCKNRIIWTNSELLKHGDLEYHMNNVNTKPSFEYQETFSSLSKNKLSIFTDGTFAPSKLYIMYMRYPQYINKEGYVMLDGEASTNVDCELPAQLQDEILDLAVQNVAMYTENPSAVQSAQFRMQTSE